MAPKRSKKSSSGGSVIVFEKAVMTPAATVKYHAVVPPGAGGEPMDTTAHGAAVRSDGIRQVGWLHLHFWAFSFRNHPPPPLTFYVEILWRQRNKGKDSFEEILNYIVKYNPLLSLWLQFEGAMA